MIYLQLHCRAKIPLGQPLLLRDVARLIGPDDASSLNIPCPDIQGIWRLEAIHIAQALRTAYPEEELTLIGSGTCYIHRTKALRRDIARPLRALAAFLILALGGALGLCWFHADVDMPRAQTAVYHAVTGKDVSDPRLLTVPYTLGVALGVSVFYALPSRKATTPLEVKLTEYQEDMEKTEAKSID